MYSLECEGTDGAVVDVELYDSAWPEIGLAPTMRIFICNDGSATTTAVADLSPVEAEKLRNAINAWLVKIKHSPPSVDVAPPSVEMREAWSERNAAIKRAEAAEARIAESAEALRITRKHWDDEKAERQRLEGEVHDLTPPEGHVAVILPREDVEAWARIRFGFGGPSVLVAACRKALGGDDG